MFNRKYDPKNEKHKQTTRYFVRERFTDREKLQNVSNAMKKAGFKLEEEEDLVKTSDGTGTNPSTRTDAGRRLEISSFKTTIWGRAITHYLVLFLEMVRIARKGACEWVLKKVADALSMEERLVFTP